MSYAGVTSVDVTQEGYCEDQYHSHNHHHHHHHHRNHHNHHNNQREQEQITQPAISRNNTVATEHAAQYASSSSKYTLYSFGLFLLNFISSLLLLPIKVTNLSVSIIVVI